MLKQVGGWADLKTPKNADVILEWFLTFKLYPDPFTPRRTRKGKMPRNTKDTTNDGRHKRRPKEYKPCGTQGLKDGHGNIR